jgi:hypothetical protein
MEWPKRGMGSVGPWNILKMKIFLLIYLYITTSYLVNHFFVFKKSKQGLVNLPASSQRIMHGIMLNQINFKTTQTIYAIHKSMEEMLSV